MALLQEIISEATRAECDVPSLLRKTLALGARLRNDELRAWVSHELNGYPDTESVPEYRRTTVMSYGYFFDRFVGQATLEVPVFVLPEEYQERFRHAILQQPINQLIDMLARSKENNNKLQLPWPVVALQYAQKVSELQCVRAWRELNPSFIAGAIDTVKTRILSMALDLEVADPNAGDVPSTNLNISQSAMSHIITTHIHGTVQNFAAGSNHVTQSANLHISPGDKSALLKSLKGAGVEDEDLQALSAAIDSDEQESTGSSKGLGARVKHWLGDLQIKAAQHLGGLTTEVVAGVVTQAILLYSGLSK
ncbi:hypothetical protein ACFQUU_08510 [Herbaspirillum sp. GCM10030257]|uniref:AbiTii domain-containing protein n=1 Tax=Herbaspirillum sp. GCM10030257 TaxID=3273393 RepID=UPI0036129D0D